MRPAAFSAALPRHSGEAQLCGRADRAHLRLPTPQPRPHLSHGPQLTAGGGRSVRQGFIMLGLWHFLLMSSHLPVLRSCTVYRRCGDGRRSPRTRTAAGPTARLLACVLVALSHGMVVGPLSTAGGRSSPAPVAHKKRERTQRPWNLLTYVQQTVTCFFT